MKNTSVAVAVSAAMFGSCACAANFEMYGVMDTGLSYTHVKGGADKLEMTSGNYAGPRVGLRGEEKISDSLTVKFIAEAGFADDTGALGESGKLFNRESQLALSGNWGTFGMGRMGGFSSGSSSMSWYWDMEPFETGYIDAGIQATQQDVWTLHSNTFYYVSPTVSGAKIGIQYALNGTNDTESSRWADNDGWMNIAARWDGNRARAVLAYESTKYGKQNNDDDAHTVKFAAVYSAIPEQLQLYAGVSWFKNYKTFSSSTWDGDMTAGDFINGKSLEGYSGFLGLKQKVGDGDALAMIQYLSGENKGHQIGAEKDFSRYVVSLGYHRYFSKRTMGYVIASFADGKDLLENNATNRLMSHIGLTHYF